MDFVSVSAFHAKGYFELAQRRGEVGREGVGRGEDAKGEGKWRGNGIDPERNYIIRPP